MEERLKGKGSFVIVAYAMPLDEASSELDAGVLAKFTYEDAGMVTGKENLMPITSLNDHEELEASVNSVLFGLETRMRDEIHQFADYYMQQWMDQWPGSQRPWWYPAEIKEPKVKDLEPFKPTKALMMKVAAGAYLQPVNSQEEAVKLPDPVLKGTSMLMTFNEEKDLDEIAKGAERSFWMLKAELATYFFKALTPHLGKERVATLLKKYGKEVNECQ